MALGLPSDVIHDIWMNGLSLCFAAWGWIALTRWGNSESSFFGVRVDNKFEDSAEAQQIDSRYIHEIIILTGALIVFSTFLLLYFRQLLPPIRPYDFWPLELLQALAVRFAYWRARNHTLPFAALTDSVRTADLSSLNSPSLLWNLLYWPCVFLPLIVVGILAFYLRAHWTTFPFPYAINFPVTENSPTIAWSLRIFLRAYWLPALAALVGITSVLLAFAFSFHSRINEWGDDDEQRWSYRKLLMSSTVALSWLATAILIIMQLNPPGMPKQIGAGSSDAWVVTAAVLIVLTPIAAVWMTLLLYYKRPPGTVSRSQDNSWKFGLYYFNSSDAAWVVPARFGTGAVLNFARPFAWILILILAGASGMRLYAGPTPRSDDPEHSALESQFAIATLQLRNGNSEGSDHLIRMARHNNDPAIWTSVAYELTAYHSRPRLAREWAEKAVASEESLTSQLRPTFTAFLDWQTTADLAASWSNLGYVCSWQGDLDCAQKYLAAAWTLDPLPGYMNELVVVLKAVPKPLEQILGAVKLENGIPVRQVTKISVPGSKAGTAYFDVLLSRTEPAAIQWFGGEKNLSGAAEIVLPTLNFPWPDEGGKEKVRVREKLVCTGVDSVCGVMALSAGEANGVRRELRQQFGLF
ncbi:MAG TPA: hypothetical protein VIH72_04305 [Candidatus Acidoferrales bacterium]